MKSILVVVQPAFHRKRIHQALSGVMEQEVAHLMAQWETAASQNQPLQLNEEMLRLTLTIMIKTMFSEDILGHADELSLAFSIAQNTVVQRLFLPPNLPRQQRHPHHGPHLL